MAYASTVAVPVLIAGGFGGTPFREFAYKSADSIATVAGSSYFTDGYTRGMRVGDMITAMQLSTASTYMGHSRGCVNAASSTSFGATVTFAATTT